jgi:hypothetical protein
MTHHAVPIKDLLKAKAALTNALATIDGLLPAPGKAEAAPAAKRGRKPKTMAPAVASEGGFQP